MSRDSLWGILISSPEGTVYSPNELFGSLEDIYINAVALIQLLQPCCTNSVPLSTILVFKQEINKLWRLMWRHTHTSLLFAKSVHSLFICDFKVQIHTLGPVQLLSFAFFFCKLTVVHVRTWVWAPSERRRFKQSYNQVQCNRFTG